MLKEAAAELHIQQGYNKAPMKMVRCVLECIGCKGWGRGESSWVSSGTDKKELYKYNSANSTSF